MIACMSMHSAPYRDTILARLQQEFAGEFDIITLYGHTTHREWKLPAPMYSDIKLRSPKKIFRHLYYHRDLLDILRKQRYSILIVQGYMPLTSLAAIIYAKWHRLKLIYCADTAIQGKGSAHCRRINIWIARHADAIWTPGMAGKELWMSVGIPNGRIFEGLYMLDDHRISQCRDEHEKLDSLKRRLYVEQKFVYLFVGNFIPSRNAPLLLDAYKRIATVETAIILIGTGEQYEAICTFANENTGLNIHVIPGVPFDELHYYYAIASAYVHPGREPYSLALQEAALMGLPIVSTREVGAAWDYLQDHKNGLIIDYNDVDQLSSALKNIRNFEVSHEVWQMCKRRNIDYAISQAKAMIQSVQMKRL